MAALDWATLYSRPDNPLFIPEANNADRAEVLAGDPRFPRSDFVTFRAVENFEKILNLAVTFLVPGGRLAVLVGASQSGSLREISRVRWEEPIPVPESHSRILALGAV